MELKDSGFSWIRKIPVNWEVRRVKQVFYQKKEKAFIDNPTILSLARDGVKIRDISTNEGQLAADYSTYNPVSKNDLLLNPMDLYSGDNCNISRVTGVISPAYVNLRNICQFDTPEFFNYYFKYQYWSMAFFAHGRGVSFDNRWTLTNEVLRNYPVLYPPVQEQKAIADYLDKECARIDDIVEKQRNIIEKLKEYKKSVITEAVTKGLNPNVTMKDSGIEWIGVVPVHWGICKIKHKNKLKTGTTPSTSIPDIFEGDVFWITPSDFNENIIIHDSSRHLNTIALTENMIALFPAFTTYIIGIGATTGKIAFSEKQASCNQQITAIIQEPFVSKYLTYYMLSQAQTIKELAQYTTLPILNNEKLGSYVYLDVPSDEQQAIANYLDQKCAEIDSVIEKREKTIDLLTEYKKSLIYECVTGKKEVA